MKKYILLGLSGFFLTCSAFLIKKILDAKRIKSQKQAIIASLPEFSFYDLDNELFSSKMLSNQPTVIFHFDSQCSHCQYEAIDFLKNIDSFKNANTLWVSEEPFESIKAFYDSFDFQKYKHVKFLKSYENEFYRLFQTRVTPSILLYNQKRQFIKKCIGVREALEALNTLK